MFIRNNRLANLILGHPVSQTVAWDETVCLKAVFTDSVAQSSWGNQAATPPTLCHWCVIFPIRIDLQVCWGSFGPVMLRGGTSRGSSRERLEPQSWWAAFRIIHHPSLVVFMRHASQGGTNLWFCIELCVVCKASNEQSNRPTWSFSANISNISCCDLQPRFRNYKCEREIAIRGSSILWGNNTQNLWWCWFSEGCLFTCKDSQSFLWKSPTPRSCNVWEITNTTTKHSQWSAMGDSPSDKGRALLTKNNKVVHSHKITQHGTKCVQKTSQMS